MSFSKDSEKIMESLIPCFKNFYKKQTPQEQKYKDEILTKIFYLINKSAIDIKTMNDLSLITSELKTVINKKTLLDIELLHSKFVPKNIKDYVLENVSGKMSFNAMINKKNIVIDFYLTEEDILNNLSFVKRMANKILIVFKFLSNMSDSKCCKTLKISVFTTPHKKQLPRTNYTVLGSNHANTAVTYHCKENGEILIYRKEELFKVCIHEMFHALGLDWHEMPVTNFKQKLRRIFKIKSTMLTPEAYSEVWGCILNCCFTGYFLCNKELEEFLLFTEYCLEIERIFSLFQLYKILKFMGINYVTLYKNDDTSKSLRKYMYKENTNIFMYYILKTLFLYNNLDFMNFCNNNNKQFVNFSLTETNMNKLYNFIHKRYDDINFITDINKVCKNIKLKSDDILKRTMRLTALELV